MEIFDEFELAEDLAREKDLHGAQIAGIANEGGKRPLVLGLGEMRRRGDLAQNVANGVWEECHVGGPLLLDTLHVGSHIPDLQYMAFDLSPQIERYTRVFEGISCKFNACGFKSGF